MIIITLLIMILKLFCCEGLFLCEHFNHNGKNNENNLYCY